MSANAIIVLIIILHACQYGGVTGVFRSRVCGATMIWPNLILAKCQTVNNTPYSAARLATLVFLSAENFLYVPRVVAVPLSISGFYHWLYIVINSVNS